MKKTILKGISFLFVFLILFSSFVFFAGAVSYENPMLSTYVVDDLFSYGFNLKDYPQDESSDNVSLMHFQEYGYNADDNNQTYYGLYVYIYNPSGAPIESDKNYIQIGVGDSDQSSNIIYRKYPLETLSYSTDPENEHLFYKFRVKNIQPILNEVDSNCRLYCISGIELNISGNRYDDYPVSQTWRYEGYQYNFGSKDPTGSLRYYVDKLETVKIDLHGARWFSQTSDYGKDFRYEISSVYFAIPNYIIKEYGNLDDPNGTSGLVSVQGTYNKYGINGLNLESEAAVNAFNPYTNRNMYQFAVDFINSGQGLLSSDYKYLKNWPVFFAGGSVNLGGIFSGSDFDIHVGYSLNRKDNQFADTLVSLLTPIPDVDVNYYQDFLMLVSQGNSPHISKQDLTSLWENSGKPCFFNAVNMYIGQHVEGIGQDTISYNISVKDANLNSQIKSWASTRKLKFLDKLFNKKLYVDEAGYPDCEPIQEITYFNLKDLFYTEEAMCNEMFMSQADLYEFDDFYDANHLNNHIYIMRFAVDPYYCVKGVAQFVNGSGETERSDCYYYEKVIYDNFDILSFTFQREDGGISVVPVNCKPISIIGSVVGTGDGSNGNGDFKDIWYYLKQLWNFLKKLKIFPILIGILVILVVIKIVWPILKKLGNAGLDVAKARASRSKNEKRDKSRPEDKSTEEKINE